MEYSCFTLLCFFLLYNDESAVCVHMSPPSWTLLPPAPPLEVTTEPWAGLPVLYSSFPLAICFACGEVYMSVLLSLFIPPSPSPCYSPVFWWTEESAFTLAWGRWEMPPDFLGSKGAAGGLWKMPPHQQTLLPLPGRAWGRLPVFRNPCPPRAPGAKEECVSWGWSFSRWDSLWTPWPQGRVPAAPGNRRHLLFA